MTSSEFDDITMPDDIIKLVTSQWLSKCPLLVESVEIILKCQLAVMWLLEAYFQIYFQLNLCFNELFTISFKYYKIQLLHCGNEWDLKSEVMTFRTLVRTLVWTLVTKGTVL